jgi:hypothetical protein
MLATCGQLLERIRLGGDNFLQLKEVKFAGERPEGVHDIGSPMSWPHSPTAAVPPIAKTSWIGVAKAPPSSFNQVSGSQAGSLSTASVSTAR